MNRLLMVNGSWLKDGWGPGRGPGARGRAPRSGARPGAPSGYYVSGGLQFELNAKKFGKTMIQAIPSNSIFTTFKAIRKSHDPSNSKQFDFP